MLISAKCCHFTLKDITSLMELIVGNSVISMAVLVRSIVAPQDTVAQAQDIMLMAIVRLKWKKLLGTQFMLTKRIIFVLRENQKRHAPIGILNIILIVLEMISGAQFLRQMGLINVRIYVYRISRNVTILLLTRQSSNFNSLLNFDSLILVFILNYNQNYMCWLKSKLVNCNDQSNVLTGTLLHYDCKDNHNCGGSFVKFQV